MDPLSSSGTLNYMVEQFLPGAIMVIVSVALVALMVRLVLFFGDRWINRIKPNKLERREEPQPEGYIHIDAKDKNGSLASWA